jgi:hypothetical protein
MNRGEKADAHAPPANGNRRRVLPVEIGSLAPPAAAWHGVGCQTLLADAGALMLSV